MTPEEEELVSAWLDGELEPGEAARLEARIGNEPGLRAEVRVLEIDRDLLRRALDAGAVPEAGLARVGRRVMETAFPPEPVALPWWETLAAWLSPPRLALAGSLVMVLAWSAGTGRPPGTRAPAGDAGVPGAASRARSAGRGQGAAPGLPPEGIRVEVLTGTTEGRVIEASGGSEGSWVARVDRPGEEIEILWLMTPDA